MSDPAASPPKVEPPDWNRWLPPEPLPDTGSKVFKVGQVWAAHTPRNNWRTVRRITGPRGASERGSEDHPTDTLAGKEGAAWGQDSFGAEHAILVQDVGEPHPRDPDVLYGRISPAPQQPAPAGKCGHPLPITGHGCIRPAGHEEGHHLWRPAPAAAPTVSGWMVPEAPTEPAQLPEVRRHDWGNPYVVGGLGRLCVACGWPNAAPDAAKPCIPEPGWREAWESELAASHIHAAPDTRPIYRPLDLGRWASDPRLVWREAAALASPRGRR